MFQQFMFSALTYTDICCLRPPNGWSSNNCCNLAYDLASSTIPLMIFPLKRRQRFQSALRPSRGHLLVAASFVSSFSDAGEKCGLVCVCVCVLKHPFFVDGMPLSYSLLQDALLPNTSPFYSASKKKRALFIETIAVDRRRTTSIVCTGKDALHWLCGLFYDLGAYAPFNGQRSRHFGENT